MIQLIRLLATLGIAVTSFLTHREFKKMSEKDKQNK